MNFTLPFIPNPYPDEILGSWLARIRLHNGGGAWYALLRETEYGERTNLFMFDILPKDKKLEKLLSILGSSYEQTMLTMTTLPYWLTFHPAFNKEDEVEKADLVPSINISKHIKPGSFNRLGISASTGQARNIYFCSKCIHDDFIKYGEPYWHRSHQLPNVRACIIHECELQIACSACGNIPHYNQRLLAPLPEMVCKCGHTQLTTLKLLPPDSIQVKLAKISARALYFGNPSWTAEQVRSYFRSLVPSTRGSSASKHKALLKEKYGLIFDSKYKDVAKTHYSNHEAMNIRLRLRICTSRAPEYCAILAAMDVSLDAASSGFTQAEKWQKKDRPRRLDLTCLSVESVRAEILLLLNKNPGLSPATYKKKYWFLRLHDEEWLKEMCPRAKFDPIPSISDDRTEIKDIARDRNFTPSDLIAKIMRHSAGVRARYRDKGWLDKEINTLKNMEKANRREAQEAARIQRERKVHSSLEKLINENGKPRLIKIKQLANMSGLTASQTREVVKSSPKLRQAIAEANADKDKRIIYWTTQQLVTAHSPISPMNIIHHSGLENSEINRKHAKMAITAITLKKTEN